MVNEYGLSGDERIGWLRDEVERLREELSRRERENDRQKRQIDGLRREPAILPQIRPLPENVLAVRRVAMAAITYEKGSSW